MKTFLRVLIVILLPAAALAEGAGARYGNSGFSEQTTNRLTWTLTRGVAACRQALPDVYRYDCYRATYADAVKDLKFNRDYAPARAVLAQVEQALAATITRYADPAAPRARQGFSRYRAIRPEALPAAREAFVAALEQAETQLLRSPDDGRGHFQRIAAALETNKVLLRSALLQPHAAPIQWAGLLPEGRASAGPARLT